MALSISGRPVPANIPKAGAVKISRLERTDSAGTSVVALAETIGRSMQQISAPFWDYSFSVPPGQVNHEGYGVTLNEINRPYLTPLVDVTSGKSLRASFEFPVVARQLTNRELLDGFSSSVDGEILFDGEVWNLGGEMLEAEIRVEFVRRLSVGETRGLDMRLFSISISFDFLVLKTCDSSPPLASADQPTVR